jgi:hypothetical protein
MPSSWFCKMSFSSRWCKCVGLVTQTWCIPFLNLCSRYFTLPVVRNTVSPSPSADYINIQFLVSFPSGKTDLNEEWVCQFEQKLLNTFHGTRLFLGSQFKNILAMWRLRFPFRVHFLQSPDLRLNLRLELLFLDLFKYLRPVFFMYFQHLILILFFVFK